MRVKTSELTGTALCYTVCMLKMPHLVWGSTIGVHHASHQIIVPELPEPKCYSPYMGWDMMGKVIEMEGISLHQLCAPLAGWGASRGRKHAQGATPLIAAMRCLVAGTMGDEVEIPDDVIGSL